MAHTSPNPMDVVAGLVNDPQFRVDHAVSRFAATREVNVNTKINRFFTCTCRCTISAVGPKIVLSRDELTRPRRKEVTSFLREFKVSVLAALGKRLHRNPTALKASATITLGASQRS